MTRYLSSVYREFREPESTSGFLEPAPENRTLEDPPVEGSFADAAAVYVQGAVGRLDTDMDEPVYDPFDAGAADPITAVAPSIVSMQQEYIKAGCAQSNPPKDCADMAYSKYAQEAVTLPPEGGF